MSRLSLILILFLIVLKAAFSLFSSQMYDFRLTYIALIGALPILVFGNKRYKIIKNIDWHTLIFFSAMFILMQAVWNSGFFQGVMTGLNINVNSISMILSVSVLLSQLISNVPLVALYLPMLIHAGSSTKEMIALAAGSTIAGNIFILGAASNVIIIQNAEKRAHETITFLEFAKVGIPLAIINIIVYYLFFVIV